MLSEDDQSANESEAIGQARRLYKSCINTSKEISILCIRVLVEISVLCISVLVYLSVKFLEGIGL